MKEAEEEQYEDIGEVMMMSISVSHEMLADNKDRQDEVDVNIRGVVPACRVFLPGFEVGPEHIDRIEEQHSKRKGKKVFEVNIRHKIPFCDRVVNV